MDRAADNASSIALAPNGTGGRVELIVDEAHFERVVLGGMLAAATSVDLATADLKAMLVPEAGHHRRAPSVLDRLRRMAEEGVEVRLLHAGVPSRAALEALREGLPRTFTLRRCPRLHAKAVVVDCTAMYLGSANLTGAGLGAKAADRRNIEWGLWTRSAELIDGVLEQFNALWEGERCDGCGRRDICPVPLEEPRLA
jgi:phosphatidylserine/phosphatidylglycerophosphate/cardiolipin synthase-like enzyme